MITLITYGDPKYRTSIKLNKWTAKHIGKADNVLSFTRGDIDQVFFQENEKILNSEPGGGYWLWKPYFIKKTLETIKEGDYLVYVDAGLYFVRSLDGIISHMQKTGKDVFLSGSLLPNGHWCKQVAFKAMGCDCEEAKKVTQCEGGFIAIRKSATSVRFVDEWLAYGCDYSLISDCSDEESSRQEAGFREHRNDQAILTNLAFLHGIRQNKGVAARSEYRYYSGLRGKNFYGYTRDELKKLAVKESSKDYFKECDYKRIVVNTRIDTNNPLLFTLRLVKKTAEAAWVDTAGVMIEKKLYKHEKP